MAKKSSGEHFAGFNVHLLGPRSARNHELGSGFFGGAGYGQSAAISNPESTHTVTYAAIQARSKAVSSVPLLIMSGDRKDPEQIVNGPLVDLIEAPNPMLSSAQFWSLIQLIMDVRGQCLILADPYEGRPFNQGQIPQELWPQDPNQYERITKKGSPLTIAWRHKNTRTEYPAHQVISPTFPSLSDFGRGVSPVDVAKVAIESDFLASNYARSFVENDCNPGAWAITKNVMTDAAFKQMQEHMKAQMQGASKAGQFHVLENIEQFVVNPSTSRDMQFLEGREFSLEEICMVFGVPKSIIGKTGDVNRATAREQKAIFFENTVLPLLKTYEDSLWSQLFKHVEGGRFWAKFDISTVPELQRDLSERIEMWTKLVTQGVPRADAATMVGLPLERFAGDDVGLVAGGLLPITEATAATADLFGSDESETAESAQDDDEEPRSQPAAAVAVRRQPAFRAALRRSRWKRATARSYWSAFRSRIIEPSERQMAKTMRAAFFRQKKEVLQAFDKMLESRSVRKDGDVVKVIGSGITDADLAAIKFNQAKWNAQLAEMTERSYQTVISKTLVASAKAMGLDPLSFDASNPVWQKLIKDRVGTKIVGINAKTLTEIRTTLQAGLALQETPGVLRRRLTQMPGFSRSRSRTVAITEIGGVANEARFNQMEQAGIQKHTWLSVGDDDVRLTHQPPLDGETVRIGEPFQNGLLRPSDPGGSAAETINCRCGAVSDLEI